MASPCPFIAKHVDEVQRPRFARNPAPALTIFNFARLVTCCQFDHLPILPHPHLHTLYSDHHGWLQGWLRKKLGNAFDAADLAQDTFVRILTAPDPTPERQDGWQLREPRAYLTVVAKRLLANLYRRRSLEQAYLDALGALPEPQAPSPEQQAIVLETLQEIDAMLDGLAPPVRQAFLMAQLEGLGYAEIALKLAVSERTVKRYMAEAMARCILLVE